jgi:hypothetical protein
METQIEKQKITIVTAEIIVKDVDGNIVFIGRAWKELVSGETKMKMEEFVFEKIPLK